MRIFSGKFFASVVWILFIGLIVYQVYYESVPCRQPIAYKIGTIDPRFKVSQADFETDIAKAASLWSSAAHKALFKYDPNGALTINLIYDDRQKLTQQENVLNSNIDAATQVAQSVKDQYKALQNQYNTGEAAYKTDLDAYNAKQTDYNNQVEYWNTRGGAPSDEFQKLQTQKNELTQERVALEQKRLAVNDLANQINALIDKYNLLVNHINENVSAINNDGLAGTQFEEGVYISDKDGTRINIYQFDNQTYFLRVLAHELGHSLGLQHNDGADSIMNPINKSTSLALSKEDVQAIDQECDIKN